MRALLGLAFITIALTPWQGFAQENQSLRDQQANESTAQQKKTDQIPPRITGEGIAEPKTGHPQKSNADDYQQDASYRLGWISIVINAVYVVVSALTLFFIYKQARHMSASVELAKDQVIQASRQADLIQKQLELSERPWVSADITFISPLTFDQRGAVLLFDLTMKNVGNSVAKYVSVWAELVVLGDNLTEAHEELCNITKQPQNATSDYGYLLFPGQVVTEHRPVIVSPQTIGRAIKDGPFQTQGWIGLHLIGCVDYQSSFDSTKHHQTRFVYIVSRNGKGGFDPTTKIYDNISVQPTLHGASAD